MRWLQDIKAVDMSLCIQCASLNLCSIALQHNEAGENDYPDAFQYRQLGPVQDLKERSESCICCKWIHDQLLLYHARRHRSAMYEGSNGLKVQCELSNPGSDTMLGYRYKGDLVPGLGRARDRVSWLALSSAISEERDDYLFVDTQLDISHAFQWCLWPCPAVSDFCAREDIPLDKYDPTFFSGRYLDLDHSPPELWKMWLNACTRHHAERCHNPIWLSKISRPGKLRLIDVERRCIVNTTGSESFIALSYMWGKVRPLTLVLDNKDQLSTPNALTEDAGLASTVEDAIRVTRALGERYLWVDALCIIQDDFQNKLHHIRQMDRIYASAVLTIVANCGTDAASGLTGVRPGSRKPHQEVLIFPEGAMISGAVNLNSTLEYSPWNSRGWTLQEKLLSRRCLIFGIDEVSWECTCDSWREETVLEVADPGDSRPLRGLFADSTRQYQSGHPLISNDHFSSFTEIVQDYTYRNLGFASDILNAFIGILSALTLSRGTRFLFGLPEQNFDTALLWTSTSGLLVFEDHTSFPSWSWLCSKGPILWYPNLLRKPTRQLAVSQLKWYSMDPSNRLREIWSAEYEVEETADISISGTPNQQIWKADPAIPTIYTIVNNEEDFINSGRIACSTSTALVLLSRDMSEGTVNIVSATGEAKERQIGTLDSHEDTLEVHEGRHYKAIAISRRVVNYLGSDNEEPTLNIMLLTRADAGVDDVWQRIAIGSIEEVRWLSLPRDFEWIVLK